MLLSLLTLIAITPPNAELAIWMDKDAYKVGEMIIVSIMVANKGKEQFAVARAVPTGDLHATLIYELVCPHS